MRATARRLLDPDAAACALPPAADELVVLLGALRGHLELMVREVEMLAGQQQDEAILRYCALAGVAEARRKLGLPAGIGLSGKVAYARRLARVLNALCQHHHDLKAAQK